MLGLTLKFYNILLNKVRSEDNNMSSDGLHQQLIEKEREREDAESKVENVADKIDNSKFILGKLQSRHKRNKGSCAATKCFSYEETFVECHSCHSLWHEKCAIQSDRVPFLCLTCQGILNNTDIEEFVRKELAKAEKVLEELKGKMNELDASISALESQLDTCSGTKEQELSSKLHKLGIDRQAYHSQSFIGNHCLKLLQNSDGIVCVLSNELDRHKMSELFNKFLDIYKLMSVKKILAEHEIESLSNMCYEFGKWFPENFPNETITIKMHLLIYHVPQFVKKYKSLRLFSEQMLESIHANANTLHRTFCSVRERPKQLKLVYTHLTLKSQVPASIKETVARKCFSCKTFLHKCNTPRKTKKCPKCDSESL